MVVNERSYESFINDFIRDFEAISSEICLIIRNLEEGMDGKDARKSDLEEIKIYSAVIDKKYEDFIHSMLAITRQYLKEQMKLENWFLNSLFRVHFWGSNPMFSL